MVTSEQIKMARAALGWSIDVLAEKTSISSRTIKRIEATIGIPNATAANLKLIKQTLEQAGVEFIGTADEGPGIRLWKQL
jgi:ribosome-binding protein aMBF1 (putative translation factor)